MTKAKSGPKQGTLIIIGGHEDHDGDKVILKEVASHVRNGKLVLATIVSHEPDGYLEKYQASFAELGVGHVTELYVEDRTEANDEAKLKALDDVQAVFFSGGDQLRITSQIGGTPVVDRVMEIYRSGGVIAGTSAGASMMSDTMLVKGTSGASFRVGDVRMAPGLGLLPNTIIDQHFAERGRIGRLIGAVSQNPRELGIGIDEDTAIVVEGDQFRVIGSGAVYLVDASGATYSDVTEADTRTTLSIHDLKLHVLSSGDRFDMVTRRPVQG
ncbi:cyanophycinase [Devosia albogilva]|uniref:Cyanophycinase n=1 Tax=Devosia albogilva TaxID=429726 RepID=A0ABW5QFW1_9HYPH